MHISEEIWDIFKVFSSGVVVQATEQTQSLFTGKRREPPLRLGTAWQPQAYTVSIYLI